MASENGSQTQDILNVAQKAYARFFEIVDEKRLISVLPVTRQYCHIRQMAMSWEGIRTFIQKIDDPHSSILDCGAGVSSVVLRSSEMNFVVGTIDEPDNEAYLSYIESLCDDTVSGYFTADWNDVKTADYTLMDYSSIGQRSKYFDIAWKHTKRAMYVDDCDTRDAFAPLRKAVYEFARNGRIHIEDCPEAKDQYGRWGVWLVRKGF